MEYEAREGDVDAGLVLAVGDGGHGAAGGLEDEADDVRGDEDPVEEFRVHARGGGVDVDGDQVDEDVDCGGEEDGRERDEDCGWC